MQSNFIRVSLALFSNATQKFIVTQAKRRTLPWQGQARQCPLSCGGVTSNDALVFDLVGPNDRSLDFHGRYFRDPKEAHEHAQLLSIDLSCAEKWQNAEVQVRDATGSRLFSVPIVEVADLRAAA